jgi:uncharacterized cupin superfamily protein
MAIETSIRNGTEKNNWTLCPIQPDWILEGAPVARMEHLSTSADGTASTYFWDCTAGRFNWYYGFDETLHILEGAVTLSFRGGDTRRLVAGDIIYFPAGAHAEWNVDSYIRKLAFCRTALPGYLVTARNMARRVKRLARGSGAKSSGGMLSAS